MQENTRLQVTRAETLSGQTTDTAQLFFMLKPPYFPVISVKGLSKTKVWAVKLKETVLCPSLWVLFLDMEEYLPFHLSKKKKQKTQQKIPGSLLLPMPSLGASHRSQEQQGDALVGNTVHFKLEDDCMQGNLKLLHCLKNQTQNGISKHVKEEYFCPVWRKSTLQRH